MELVLSKEEVELLEELLSVEQNTLPVEIHHCRVSDYKDLLKKKQSIVVDLLKKIQKGA